MCECTYNNQWKTQVRVRVRFLAKPGFWSGSFWLGSGSFPSLCIIFECCKCACTAVIHLDRVKRFKMCTYKDCTQIRNKKHQGPDSFPNLVQLCLFLLISLPVSIPVSRSGEFTVSILVNLNVFLLFSYRPYAMHIYLFGANKK